MYLWILFDAIAVMIFIICITTAYKKGLIRASHGIVSIILTMVFMLVFQDSITQYVKSSSFGEGLEKRIEELLTENLTEKEEKDSEAQEEISEKEKKDKFGLPEFLENIIIDKTEIIEETKKDMITKTAQSISASVINILSIIVLYFLIRLALFLVLKILDAVFSLPLLKTVNKFGGALLGIVNALFIIYILCAALIWFIPGDSTGEINEAINQTYAVKYFYNDNLLLKFFIK